VLLRFGDIRPPDLKEWEPIAVEARAGGGIVSVKLRKAENATDLQSYLVLSGGNGLTLEIAEESLDPSREATRQLLRETNEELQAFLRRRAELEKHGYLKGLAPPESVRSGTPSLSVEPAGPDGGFDVVGYANPGEPGSVSLRIGGAPAGPDRERIGWSGDPRQLFFFNCRLPDLESPTGVEAWFHPDSGGPERKLVDGRVRGPDAKLPALRAPSRTE
jgi:hypothetical protein